MVKTYTLTHQYNTVVERIKVVHPYITLHINSEFRLPINDGGIVKGYDIFGNERTIPYDQITVTGYDMSTAGYQTLTYTYVNDRGQVLTDTNTLHVFTDTNYRTI
jgi:hypothetical protein